MFTDKLFTHVEFRVHDRYVASCRSRWSQTMSVQKTNSLETTNDNNTDRYDNNTTIRKCLMHVNNMIDS